MVSLPDPASSSSATSSGSSSRKIRQWSHAHARSVRTIRSNLLYDAAAAAPPDAGAAASPPPPPSSAVAEASAFDDLYDYSDSVVDFTLRELAVSCSAASVAARSRSIDAADLLDLSGSFSDSFSSFNSDVSGELQKLASIPTASPSSSSTSAAAGCPRRHSDDDDGHRLDLDDDHALVAITSELMETASPEILLPAVAALVDALESPAHCVKTKRAAAAELRLLAKQRSDFRVLIGDSSRAIPALIPLLRSSDPATQENAVTALLNLSLEERNKGQIAAAGAIKPVVYALKTGTATAKQNAACLLLSLSMVEGNAATIGVCGAVPPLVSLLIQGSSRGKKDAVTTLYKLCSSSAHNKELAVRAGAVRPLVTLLRQLDSDAQQGGGGLTEKAMVVLSSLAGIQEGRDAIVEEGGIQALVEAVDGRSSMKSKEFALLTMIHLCSGCRRNRFLLVSEGAIPPLVALSQLGTARFKHKAETLLGYLRDQPHLDDLDDDAPAEEAPPVRKSALTHTHS